MGAYEFRGTPLCLGGIDGDGAVLRSNPSILVGSLGAVDSPGSDGGTDPTDLGALGGDSGATFGPAVGARGGVGARTRADIVIDVGRGPVVVRVPPSYDPAIPTPLVLGLHGYNRSGAQFEDYLSLESLSDDFGFLHAYPDGTTDLGGRQFWNAGSADFFETGVDDLGYLYDLIAAIKLEAKVDDGRVHLVGHSNGGFMSYRMACTHADTIASIVSIAGSMPRESDYCNGAEPLHTLRIHGTADRVVLYLGGCRGPGCYPGAVASAERWASYNECSLIGEPGDPIDFDAGIPGPETEVIRYVDDCSTSGSSELWTVVDGGHKPLLHANGDSGRPLIAWLYAHPQLTGELDGDGDVDLADFAVFAACFTGEGITVPPAGCTTQQFHRADTQGDNDVDLADFTEFQAAFTGPSPASVG
jgi:polyhydroxybutyrate depolymerase